MKTVILFMASLLLAAGCTKDAKTKTSPRGNSDVVQGKVVYRSCATIVVQVLDSAHFGLGQLSWQKSTGDPIYSHVFVVENHCAFPGNINVGDHFTFTVKPSVQDPDCFVCALWDNPPSKKHSVVVEIQ
jgi:hypothetical protein